MYKLLFLLLILFLPNCFITCKTVLLPQSEVPVEKYEVSYRTDNHYRPKRSRVLETPIKKTF